MAGWKDTAIANPGTSIKYGADDIEMLMRGLNGITTGINSVEWKSTNKWGFWDNILYIRNQSDTFNTTLRGASNNAGSHLTLSLPPITANDILASLGLQNVFSATQQLNAGIILQQESTPANPSSGFQRLYAASNGHLVKRNSSGAEVDYDSFISGLPTGLDKYIQYNNGGVFGSEAGFEYNQAVNEATIPGLTVTENLTASGTISPPQITTTQNNYNPTGLATSTTLRLTTDASRDITGITAQSNGTILFIHNVGSFNIVLKDESASSTTTNRFAMASDITLAPDNSACIKYDSTTGRWRLVSTDSINSNIALLSAANTFTGNVSLNSGFLLTNIVSPSQITSNQNNYAPTGIGTANVLRLSTDASRNITGITTGVEGRIIVIHNIGSQSIVLKDEDVNSTATNRFALSGDLTLSGDHSTIIKYDGVTGRWRSLIPPLSSGGAPADAQYATLSTNGTLSNERVITAGDGIKITDGGAGGNITFDHDLIDETRKRVFYYSDCFDNGEPLNTETETGDATNAIIANTESGVFGVYQLSTGTAATNAATIHPESFDTMTFGQGQVTFEFYVRFPTLSTGTQRYSSRLGFLDVAGSTAVVDGVFFLYDEAVSPNWIIKTRNNSTESTATSTTAVGTGWTRLKIVVNAAGTSASFFVGGTELSGSPLTTNIPNTASRQTAPVFGIIKSVGTTARTLLIDYYVLEIDLTTPR